MISTCFPLIATILLHYLCFRCTRSITCHDNSECTSLGSINQTGGNTVECYGYLSCAFMSVVATTNTKRIECKGSYSCYNTSKIERTDESGSDNDILCEGLFACANVNNMVNNNGQIHCRGERSCSNSIIRSVNDYIFCLGSRSCEKSIIYVSVGVYLRAYLSGYNTTIYSNSSDVSIILRGMHSGYGARIICGIGHTCTVTCYTKDCNELKEIRCIDNNETSCNIILNCDYSEKNDLCPNGYELGLGSPNLFNVTMSEYNNSETICSTGKGYNSTKCIDYSGCANIEISAINPVCCGASDACRYATNITTLNGNIRCDGEQSCEFGSNSSDIMSKDNNGNMYFTANIACGSYNGIYGTIRGSSTNNKNNNNSNNVFATGRYAIIESKVANVNNIYAMGASSVRDCIVSNVDGDIFGYANGALLDSTISNVGGSVYCISYIACQGTQISNVAGSVVVNGLQAMASSQMTNTTNVYCNGPESCKDSVIQNVNKYIHSSGNNSLSGATIISENDGINELLLEINSTNYDKYNVFCNSTDTCRIDCQNKFACRNMTLTCDGICYVYCNPSIGISCPSGDFILWTTRPPTGIPSMTPSGAPTSPTLAPTNIPSFSPTNAPVTSPTNEPSYQPSYEPSNDPTKSPSNLPSSEPTTFPTSLPTTLPTNLPSIIPSDIPTYIPSGDPTVLPSIEPSTQPSQIPSMLPSNLPSGLPSVAPSYAPSEPTIFPTVLPSSVPSSTPSRLPSSMPSSDPSPEPTSMTTSMTTMVGETVTSSNTAAMASEAEIDNNNDENSGLTFNETLIVIVGIICGTILIAIIVIVCSLRSHREAKELAHKKHVEYQNVEMTKNNVHTGGGATHDHGQMGSHAYFGKLSKHSPKSHIKLADRDGGDGNTGTNDKDVFLNNNKNGAKMKNAVLVNDKSSPGGQEDDEDDKSVESLYGSKGDENENENEINIDNVIATHGGSAIGEGSFDMDLEEGNINSATNIEGIKRTSGEFVTTIGGDDGSQ